MTLYKPFPLNGMYFAFVGLLLGVFSLAAKVTFVGASIHDLRMFTMWVLTMQIVYFAALFLIPWHNDILRELKHAGRICSVLMAIMFWSIYLYDKDLIAPGNSNMLFAIHLLLHVMPPLLFVFDPTRVRGKPKLAISVGIGAAYAALLLTWFLYKGTWPYPFMKEITFKAFSMLVSMSLTCMWGIHKAILFCSTINLPFNSWQ